MVSLHERYPFDEVIFWPRMPGVPFSLAMEHLERLSEGLMKLVGP